MSGLDLFDGSYTQWMRALVVFKGQRRRWRHACLLFDTLVVTAVTEAKEIASTSRPPPKNMAWRSRFSASRTAGSSVREATTQKVILIRKSSWEHNIELKKLYIFPSMFSLTETFWIGQLAWKSLKLNSSLTGFPVCFNLIFCHPAHRYLHSCPPCAHGAYCASCFKDDVFSKLCGKKIRK